MPIQFSSGQGNRDRRHRRRMLAKVRTMWIEDVLEPSLRDSSLIAVGLREQLDAIANPWRPRAQDIDQVARMLPPGTRITQMYDRSGGMLILGEPGSGKTTLLLELARNLLARADQDEAHPMPVVFNLSSWALKRRPITDWLVEELITKYQVPREIARTWVDTDQILPLLDGLDEVTPRHYAACIEAINTYRRAHSLVPTVVCSRSAHYLNQTDQLQLPTAIVVQPLTSQQVDDYLSSLTGVRVTLRTDPALRELTTTPLMLNILTQAYRGKAAEDLLVANSLEASRQQVLATYVRRMLDHRGSKTYYTPEQTTHWLSWLAQQMKKHRQTVFYIEHVQPDWLPDNRSHRVYSDFVGLVACLILGLVFGSVFGLILWLLFGLVFGLILWLLFWLVSRLVKEIQTTDTIWSKKAGQRASLYSDVLWLIVVPALGVGVGWTWATWRATNSQILPLSLSYHYP